MKMFGVPAQSTVSSWMVRLGLCSSLTSLGLVSTAFAQPVQEPPGASPDTSTAVPTPEQAAETTSAGSGGATDESGGATYDQPAEASYDSNETSSDSYGEPEEKQDESSFTV